MVAVLGGLLRTPSPRSEAKPPTWQSSGPTVESIQRMAELLSLRVGVTDVLTGEGYGYRGAWIVKGDAVFGIDVGKIGVPHDLMNDVDRTATIVLPRPSIRYARVNHELTQTWEVSRDSWWRLPSGDRESRLRDESMLEAQRVVEFAANKPEHLREAETHAASLIRSMYQHVGWDVTIVWAPETTEGRSKEVQLVVTE